MEKPSPTDDTYTVTQVSGELMAHERECAVRYESLEKRLDDGQHRFVKLEQMIWGVYVLLIASGVISEILS